MSRRCKLCGGDYLGNGNCTGDGCPRQLGLGRGDLSRLAEWIELTNSGLAPPPRLQRRVERLVRNFNTSELPPSWQRLLLGLGRSPRPQPPAPSQPQPQPRHIIQPQTLPHEVGRPPASAGTLAAREQLRTQPDPWRSSWQHLSDGSHRPESGTAPPSFPAPEAQSQLATQLYPTHTQGRSNEPEAEPQPAQTPEQAQDWQARR